MDDPFDHLYYHGKKTQYKPGDIIKHAGGNRYRIYRDDSDGEERIYIGNVENPCRDDSETIYNTEGEFLRQIAKISGCFPEESSYRDEYETVCKMWTLVW